MHLSWTFQVVVHFTAKAEEAEAKITVVLVKKSGRGLGLSVVLSSFAEWCQNDVRMRSQCWNVAGGTERRSGSFHLGSCPRWARWTERRLAAGIFTIFPGEHLFTIFHGKHLFTIFLVQTSDLFFLANIFPPFFLANIFSQFFLENIWPIFLANIFTAAHIYTLLCRGTRLSGWTALTWQTPLRWICLFL